MEDCFSFQGTNFFFSLLLSLPSSLCCLLSSLLLRNLLFLVCVICSRLHDGVYFSDTVLVPGSQNFEIYKSHPIFRLCLVLQQFWINVGTTIFVDWSVKSVTYVSYMEKYKGTKIGFMWVKQDTVPVYNSLCG